MSRVKFISRMHDVRTPETLDKALLLLAFLVGVFGGLAIKLLHVHPFVAAAFAALVLVLYATLTFFTTHLQLEPEVIGDNCYYLAFCSLSPAFRSHYISWSKRVWRNVLP